jgi:ribosomal protein S18 acetylase RimI-like enzyme
MAMRLRPMTDPEYERWLASDLESYVQERMRSGEPEEVARHEADKQQQEYFPGGKPGPGHRLLTVESEGAPVGMVWVGPHPKRPEHAESVWLFNIEIDASARGQGLGRAALDLLERQLLTDGRSELSLNVFGHNTVARRLYKSAGYREAAITMTKSLTS